MRAKVLFSSFVTWHNATFAFWSQIVSPDSAKPGFQIARSPPILNVVAPRHRRSNLAILDPSLHQDFVEHVQSNPFSLVTDESNVRNCDKSLDNLVRCYISTIGHEPASLHFPKSWVCDPPTLHKCLCRAERITKPWLGKMASLPYPSSTSSLQQTYSTICSRCLSTTIPNGQTSSPFPSQFGQERILQGIPGIHRHWAHQDPETHPAPDG